MSENKPTLTAKDFASDQDVRWCPGCGDYAILKALQQTMPQLGVEKENIVFVSGIGCAGRLPYYMDTYGFHTIHGRAPTIATGLSLTRPDLSLWVITGDGDALSIGGNHFMHLMRRDLNINILLFNNRIYGLTKGQYSPTSERGKVTKTSPTGSRERPLEPLQIALAAGASFVARSLDVDIQHLQKTLLAAAKHQGTSVVEIYQNCNIYNDGAFDKVSDKKQRPDNSLYLESGQPMLYGAEQDKGLVIEEGKPQIVTSEEAATHNPDNCSMAHAMAIAGLSMPSTPISLGVIRRATPVDNVSQQATADNDALSALLAGKQSWEV